MQPCPTVSPILIKNVPDENMHKKDTVVALATVSESEKVNPDKDTVNNMPKNILCMVMY